MEYITRKSSLATSLMAALRCRPALSASYTLPSSSSLSLSSFSSSSSSLHHSMTFDYGFVPLSYTLPDDYTAFQSMLSSLPSSSSSSTTTMATSILADITDGKQPHVVPSTINTDSPLAHGSTTDIPLSSSSLRTWIVKPHAMAKGNVCPPPPPHVACCI